MAVPIDVYLKAAAALVSFTFAVVVLAGGPRRAPNLFLSAFFLLIAGNQGAEALRAVATDAAGRILWYRVATAFAALDPVFLYYFASIYPERGPLNRRRYVAAVLAAGVAFAALAPFLLPSPRTTGVPKPPWHDGVVLGLVAFTAAAYTAALASSLRALARRPGSEPHRLTYPVYCLAAIPVWSRLGFHATLFTTAVVLEAPKQSVAESLAMVALPALLVALLLAAAWRLRRQGNAAYRVVAGGAVAAMALVLALRMHVTTWLATTVALGRTPAFVETALYHNLHTYVLGHGGAAVRWIVICTLLSVAVLRFRMLGMSLASRRAAARLLVGLAGVSTAAVLLAVARGAAGSAGVEVRPLDAVLLGVVLLASQGFRSLVDRAAAWVYGVPMPGDREAALAAYRAAVAQAHGEGRSTDDDRELRRLREELAVGAHEAQVLERMAEATLTGPLLAGRVVGGRYHVEAFLGRGGFGRAFRARDDLLGRAVVLKEVLHDGDESEEAALAEARAAGALQHPHVVTIYDVLRRPGASLLVTEHLPGGSLHERLEREGPLPVAEAVRLVCDVLAGLAAVHARGVVHRDVKPHNVLLAGDGAAKVADFGLARNSEEATARVQMADAFEGTPEWVAPEQRLGLPATPATDVHAAGLLLERCARGPLPAPVAAVVARALAEAPAERWPSAEAMARALREAAAEAGVPLEGAAAAPPVAREGP